MNVTNYNFKNRFHFNDDKDQIRIVDNNDLRN